jgi:hypothetical protein
MELNLTELEADIVHRIIERYLDELRASYGEAQSPARAILGEEQEALAHVLRKLHELKMPA